MLDAKWVPQLKQRAVRRTAITCHVDHQIAHLESDHAPFYDLDVHLLGGGGGGAGAPNGADQRQREATASEGARRRSAPSLWCSMIHGVRLQQTSSQRTNAANSPIACRISCDEPHTVHSATHFPYRLVTHCCQPKTGGGLRGLLRAPTDPALNRITKYIPQLPGSHSRGKTLYLRKRVGVGDQVF